MCVCVRVCVCVRECVHVCVRECVYGGAALFQGHDQWSRLTGCPHFSDGLVLCVHIKCPSLSLQLQKQLYRKMQVCQTRVSLHIKMSRGNYLQESAMFIDKADSTQETSDSGMCV